MGGAYSRHRDKRDVYKSLVVRPEKRGRLESLGLGGSIILKWSFKKWNREAWSGSGRGRWWAVVDAVMNFWIPQIWGND
jgi:hypothetical protein